MGLFSFIPGSIRAFYTALRGGESSDSDSFGEPQIATSVQSNVQSIRPDDKASPSNNRTLNSSDEAFVASSDMSVKMANLDLTATKEGNSKPRLFGLLIGINTYNRDSHVVSASGDRGSRLFSKTPQGTTASFTNLRGAVADAQNFQDYLTSDLGIPGDQVQLLCDKEATREKIIKSFRDLATSEKIQYGDAIVIFYAGHGAQALPPKRLERQTGCPTLIELLVPYDFNDYPEKQEYMGIPDYTLAALLNQIAEVKGNNITVIFDCCHSASALRGGLSTASNQSHTITRAGPELKFHLPDALDQEIWGAATYATRGMTTFPRLRHLGAASYVFFSACASYELAREEEGRGCFSSALLVLLKELGSHTLSCSQIITRLNKIKGQSPQCEGRHADRFIFHGFSSSLRKRFFYVSNTRKGRRANVSSSEFILEGGSVDGFTIGDEFTVYDTESNKEQTRPIGKLILHKFSAREDLALLKIPDGAPPFVLPCTPAPALLTRPASPYLQLYIGDTKDASLVSRIDELDLYNTISIASDRKSAHIALSSAASQGLNQLRFEVVDTILVDRGLDCGHHLVDDSIEKVDLAKILKDLAHYYWHLKRGTPNDPSFPVDISLYELEQNDPPQFLPIDADDNLYNSALGVVELDVDDELDQFGESVPLKPYGMKVTNNSPDDLYPALFYFDNLKFTIETIYHSSLAKNNAESPLKKGESITIGYGLGAGATVPPFTFSLSDTEKDMEFGFLKLILSTSPINLQHIEQKNPVFEQYRSLKQIEVSVGSAPPISWASFNILVIQRLRE
ncbi:hypothetical protein BDN70DRAFT_838545 [Pholiota conissans]|uniref:Peptidase C14 caspase domain-containing protein n=1 Tax=Pholiota conissans TaxID=109636 RepID=A0A9P5YXH5_9AGAR|nr:hypothetical protein BDN70DRAFT_838545 [Pholiota conissans]